MVRPPTRSDGEKLRFPIRFAGFRLSLSNGFVAFAVTICLAISAAFVVNIIHERDVAVGVARRGAENLSESLAQQASETFDAADGALRVLSQHIENKGAGLPARVRLRSTMAALIAALPRIHSLAVADEHGRVVVSNSSVTGVQLPSVFDRPYFGYHRSHPGLQLHISGPARNKLDKDWVLFATRRLDHADGSFAGVAIAPISLDVFARSYANVDVGRLGNITLFGDDGTVLVRKPLASIGRRFGNVGFRAGPSKNLSAGWYIGRSRVDGILRLFAFRRVRHRPLAVLVAVAESEYLAEWRSDGRTTAIVLALILALIAGLAITLRELALKRRQAEQRLAFAAFHDALTGLANRALLMDRLNQIVTKRYDAAHRWAIVFLDLDRFKVINDSLGHSVGDLVLVEAATRLKRCLHNGDTLARLGGDEFIILLDDIEDMAAACEVAQRVLCAFNAPFVLAGREISASASIGIAMSHNSDDRPEDVLRNADIAMYRAKELGKQRYELFSAELLTRAVDLHELETDLARALERDEFCLYYQPIISLHDGHLTGFEALVRWQHPRRGLLNPDSFISLAEETGAVVAIGEWVLREACLQLQAWRLAFAVAHDLRMNVNVSARQVVTPYFARTVASALSASGLHPGGLNIEITESVFLTDADAARSTLTELRRLGVHIHLDDFGTGYSSLAYLHHFPIDALKIDRSFVSDSKVCNSEGGLTSIEIVRMIVALAQSLSLAVTAEGVETDEQRKHLRALGCTNAQGYYFSRPVDASKAGALITEYVGSLQEMRMLVS